jgi:hypothetical protein
LLLAIGVKMKAADSIETLVHVYRTAWNEVQEFGTYIAFIFAKRA